MRNARKSFRPTSSKDRLPAEMKQDEDTFTSKNKYKNVSQFPKETKRKLLCPFACPNCICLGGAIIQSKYEIVNILADTGDSIFSPMHEKYTEEHKSSIRNGRVFVSADLVDDFVEKIRK